MSDPVEGGYPQGGSVMGSSIPIGGTATAIKYNRWEPWPPRPKVKVYLSAEILDVTDIQDDMNRGMTSEDNIRLETMDMQNNNSFVGDFNRANSINAMDVTNHTSEICNTNDDSNLSFYDGYWVGQIFTIGATGQNTSFYVNSVKIRCSRIVTPGIVTVSIRNTSSNLPTGTDLAIGTTNGDTLSNNPYYPEWREIFLNNPVLLTPGKYAVIARCASTDSSKRVLWRYDASGSSYTGGTICQSNDSGITWTSSSPKVAMFEVWGLLPSNFDGVFDDTRSFNITGKTENTTVEDSDKKTIMNSKKEVETMEDYTKNIDLGART